MKWTTRTSDPKRRKVHAPDPTGGDIAPHKLDGINAVLAEHSRQIETLAAANKVLEGRNAALEERCEALGRKSKSLERSCDKLEVRCSSLERSIQVLKKDVNWTYSAPDIPWSHWIDQGHSEDYAVNIEERLQSIKDNVDRIRNGAEGYYCSCLDNEGMPTILHDDSLLPHFKEVADAIQLSTRIGQINIDNIELRPSALSIIFPAMEGKVPLIDMRRVRFPADNIMECYEIIAAAIGQNIKLERFVWESIDFSSDEQADLFIKSVLENWAIKSITLANCFNQNVVTYGCRALASLMMCGRPLQRIDFSDNGLSGVDDVATALATNPPLETLALVGNSLNNSDAELIAEALKQNTNLKMLNLDGNNITSDGFEKIGTAIYDPSSLNAVASCNHTCCVECGDSYVGVNYSGMTPQERRRCKLYKMLSSRHAVGSNARHLNSELGVGTFVTKLVPGVLECIEKCSIDRLVDSPVPLSLYFELMRSWKMPELYEHRGTFEGD